MVRYSTFMSIYGLVLWLSTSLESQAQTRPSFWVKAGPVLSFSNQKDDSYNDRFSQVSYSYNAGALLRFHIGVAAELPLTEKMIVQPEVFFWQGGFKEVETENDQGDSRKVTNKYRINYLRLSPLGKLYIGEKQDMRLYVLVGPYFQLGLWGKQVAKASYNGQTEIQRESLSFGNSHDAFMPRFDAGFSLGGGVEKQMSFGYTSLDLRYNLGLRDLSGSKSGLFSEDAFRFNSFQLSLGLKLPNG